ncbi:MAG: hypothetical protein QXL02_02760 [Candidatus Anstonellales archaeon]
MRAQLTLETVIIYGLQSMVVIMVLGSILMINQMAIYAIDRHNTLKERAFLRDLVSEICVIGDGMRYSVYIKYDHNLSGRDMGCWGGDLKLKGGYKYTIENINGYILARPD